MVNHSYSVKDCTAKSLGLTRSPAYNCSLDTDTDETAFASNVPTGPGSRVIIPTTDGTPFSGRSIYWTSSYLCHYQTVLYIIMPSSESCWTVFATDYENQPNQPTGDPADHTQLCSCTYPQRYVRTSPSQFPYNCNNVKFTAISAPYQRHTQHYVILYEIWHKHQSNLLICVTAIMA
jgi:hypothetical protein